MESDKDLADMLSPDSPRSREMIRKDRERDAKQIERLISQPLEAIKEEIQTLSSHCEIKKYKDRLDLVQDLLRRSHAATTCVNKYAIAKLCCDRKLGEELLRMEKAKGTRGQLKGNPRLGGSMEVSPKNGAPSYKSIGIPSSSAKRYQLLARAPLKTVEEFFARKQEANEMITLNELLKEVKGAVKKAKEDDVGAEEITKKAKSIIKTLKELPKNRRFVEMKKLIEECTELLDEADWAKYRIWFHETYCAKEEK